MQRRSPFPHSLALGLAILSVAAPERTVAAWWQLWQPAQTNPPSVQKGERVKIQFQGNTRLSESQLRSAIEEQINRLKSEGLSRANADDAAYYTAVFYHQCGYHSAEVAWKIEKDNLVLSIQEGPKVRLLTATIAGNLTLPSSQLLSTLTSVTASRLKKSAANLPFVLDDLQMGANRILDLYISEGFLDAQVDTPEFTFSDGGEGATVLVTLREGKQYRFGQINFRGEIISSRDELLKTLSPTLEKPYTAPRRIALQNALQKFYASRGHFEATVEVQEEPPSPEARVPLTITIRPGPVYRFQGVEAEGLVRLRERWLKNRLSSLEGKTFDPDLLSRKQQDLLSSGLFESLRITPIPNVDRTLRLKVEVSEPAYRELGVSLGYGSYEGAMGGVRLANRNLFGNGILGSIELNVSQRALALETALSDPWLFETRTEFVTRAFIRSRVELGYEKRDAGIRGELSRRLLPSFRAAAFGQIRTVEITNSLMPPDELGTTAYQIGTVGTSLTWDKRDNILNPSTGWITSLLAESNTLSDGATFTRTSGRLGWHYPLPGRIRFAVSARAGILSLANAVPIDERYFLGGATTVRSFQERELGPQSSSGFPTGGASYSLLNAETDFPLWQNLGGAFFYDTGSLALKGGNIATSNFRSAVGVGLRYSLPFGPVRFDVGVNPDRQPTEHWGAAHLSFGFAF